MNGLNVRSIICSLFCATLLFGVQTDDFLSSLKSQTIKLQHQKNDFDSQKLHNSWINPLTIRYGYSHSDQFGHTQVNRQISVRVDQPIFKSGGIWYAIKYAKASEKVGNLSIEAQRRTLIKEAVATLFNLRKNGYQQKKQKLLIQNDRIDILRKKEQYLSGDLDSSFLDQAILQKNRDTLALFGLQDARSQLEQQFKNLSDLDPQNATLPHFYLMDKSTYLKNDIDLKKQRAQIDQKDYFNSMTWARYLMTFSLQGSYVRPLENSAVFGGSLPDATKPYRTYGFTISMPIDVTSIDDIQSTKIDYLNAKLDLEDQKRDANNAYISITKRLKVVDEKMQLASEDELLYEKLTKSTKDSVKAGEKTTYDLQTMENSTMIRRIDKRIYMIDRQLILLDLYEKSYEAF